MCVIAHVGVCTMSLAIQVYAVCIALQEHVGIQVSARDCTSVLCHEQAHKHGGGGGGLYTCRAKVLRERVGHCMALSAQGKFMDWRGGGWKGTCPCPGPAA